MAAAPHCQRLTANRTAGNAGSRFPSCRIRSLTCCKSLRWMPREVRTLNKRIQRSSRRPSPSSTSKQMLWPQLNFSSVTEFGSRVAASIIFIVKMGAIWHPNGLLRLQAPAQRRHQLQMSWLRASGRQRRGVSLRERDDVPNNVGYCFRNANSTPVMSRVAGFCDSGAHRIYGAVDDVGSFVRPKCARYAANCACTCRVFSDGTKITFSKSSRFSKSA